MPTLAGELQERFCTDYMGKGLRMRGMRDLRRQSRRWGISCLIWGTLLFIGPGLASGMFRGSEGIPGRSWG